MMVAVSCSGLCSTYAIFELKYDTISLYVLFSYSLQYLLRKLPVKAFISGLYYDQYQYQYQQDIPSTLLLIQDVPASCFLVSSPLKLHGKKELIFHPQEMPVYFKFEYLFKILRTQIIHAIG